MIGQTGRHLVLERGEKTVLWSAGHETPLKLARRADRSLIRVADDGAMVWYQRKDNRLAAHRVADGRELLLGPGLSPMTDEGVFDPKDAEHLPVLVRSGPNLIDSRFTPLRELAAKYAHADLLKDFFAGAPVSAAR